MTKFHYEVDKEPAQLWLAEAMIQTLIFLSYYAQNYAFKINRTDCFVRLLYYSKWQLGYFNFISAKSKQPVEKRLIKLYYMFFWCTRCTLLNWIFLKLFL